MSTVAIIDYGVGNLFSLASSLKAVGANAIVTGDKDEIKKADKLILPGVGAFEDAARKLRESGLDEVIKQETALGKPLLGICLGMQLLFDKSYEFGIHDGLGLISGEIKAISDYAPKELKIPHIGWNMLHLTKDDCPIFKYLSGGEFVYFVHSFFGTDCEADTAAVTEYGCVLTAAVAKDNIFGCQFHPEKSGEVGLKILKAFSEI